MGLTAITLFTASLLAVRNQRIMAAWTAREARDAQRAATGLPPRTAAAAQPSPAALPRPHNQHAKPPRGHPPLSLPAQHHHPSPARPQPGKQRAWHLTATSHSKNKIIHGQDAEPSPGGHECQR